MDIQLLGIMIVLGTLGLGFIGLGIYVTFFDKTPRTYIRKPPSWLNNKKENEKRTYEWRIKANIQKANR